LSNKVFKNHQINLGLPFQVKVPLDELLDGYYGSTRGKMEIKLDGRTRHTTGSENLSGSFMLSGAKQSSRLGVSPDVLTAGLSGTKSMSGTKSVSAGNISGVSPGLDDPEGYGVLNINGSVFASGETDVFSTGGLFPEIGEACESGLTDDAGDAETSDSLLAEAERILSEARAESAEIMAMANYEARMLIEKTRRQADAYAAKAREQIEAEAAELRERSRADGELEGREEGKAAYDLLIAEAQRLCDETDEKYKKLMAGAESEALELILGIAKKVIGEELAVNRENLIYMIKDAFMHCTNKENVILKVAQDDFDYVLLNRDLLLSMIEGVDRLDIKCDLALAPGACLIETPFGNLDAGVTTRMSKIEDVFYRVLSAYRPAAVKTA
jgi:flagellar assembly protein FliH